MIGWFFIVVSELTKSYDKCVFVDVQLFFLEVFSVSLTGGSALLLSNENWNKKVAQ